jgi:hypothetical protein
LLIATAVCPATIPSFQRNRERSNDGGVDVDCTPPTATLALIRVAAMMLEGFEFADCVRKEPAEQQAEY